MIETLSIEIGEKLLPYLTDFVNWAIPMIDRYGPLLIAFFDGLTSGASWLWEKLQPLREPIDGMMEAFNGLAKALGLDQGENGWLYTLFAKVIELNVTAWINSVTTTIESITTALDVFRQIVEWLSGDRSWKDMFVDIKLPAWLTPGSPTPFETGLRGITDAMTELSRLGAPQLQMALAGAGSTTNNNYYLTAQYRREQSEGSLMDDVRTLSIMTGGRA